MKILAFADMHGSITKLKKIQQKAKKYSPDIIICLGDFTIFEKFIDIIIKKISDMKKPTYIIHGNHETAKITEYFCKKYENLTFAHKKIIPIRKYQIIGYGGGGFSTKDPGFEKFIKKNHNKIKNKKTIIITHGPPYKTKLDQMEELKRHVGCESYTNYIKKYKPTLALSGHLHETSTRKDKIGKTQLLNPGPSGTIINI